MSYRNCVSCRAARVSFLSIVLTLILLPNLPKSALCGPPDPIYPDPSTEIQWIQLMNQPTHRALNPRPDLLPRGKDGDWQPMIDAVWGPGFPGAEQATVLQNFMTVIDEEFATFINGYDVDIDELIAPYLSEVNAGVSRGRFQGIMNRLCHTLQNGHTNFIDLDVYSTLPEPGVPLLVGHRYLDNRYFGACLTTGESGTFVYDVVENHPLGLEIGDVILGYEGRPWSELYQELLDAELPIGSGGWLTSDASYEYGWDVAVGNNWHLFQTIDIQKYGTGEVQHLPTALMVDSGVDFSLLCTDQINQDIARPTTPEWATWGVLNEGGKRIGFIWCDAWIDNVGVAWEQACLAMVNDPDLDGLIIDFRNNMGGNMNLSNDGLGHLFNQNVITVDFGYRINPHNHLFLFRQGNGIYYAIPGNSSDFFDKPIAVLLGPKTISSGDQVAFRMTYHPRVRTFGRPTSATFDSPVSYSVYMHEEFQARFAKYNAGRVETPQSYLSNVGFPVDQEVWLDPEDCRNGIDTVIEEAIGWMSASSVDGEFQGVTSRITSAAPNPANPRTVISWHIEKAGPCSLGIYDISGRLIRSRQWAHLDTGAHDFTWDGIMNTGKRASSGTYLVRMEAADGAAETRVTLVK